MTNGIGRAILLVALVTAALCLGTPIGKAQQSGPTFVYHGNISTERQADIEEEYGAVAAWFEEQYHYRPTSFTIQIGATASALADVLRSAGHDVPGGVGPCFWSGGYGYLLVDGCESPLPFARLHVTEVAFQLARNSAATIEQGHFSAGPAWLVHGAEEFGESDFLASTGQDDLASQRQRHVDQIRDLPIDLARLEVTTNFWGSSHNRSIGWIAVDNLTQIAGPGSYLDFFRQRGKHARWQDAFQAAFGLETDAFYVQFPQYIAELEVAAEDAVAAAWRDRWWRHTRESGQTVEVPITQRGLFLNWYGIDISVAQFLDWYPSVDLVAQWSASRERFIGAHPRCALDSGNCARYSQEHGRLGCPK